MGEKIEHYNTALPLKTTMTTSWPYICASKVENFFEPVFFDCNQNHNLPVYILMYIKAKISQIGFGWASFIMCVHDFQLSMDDITGDSANYCTKPKASSLGAKSTRSRAPYPFLFWWHFPWPHQPGPYSLHHKLHSPGHAFWFWRQLCRITALFCHAGSGWLA